MLGQSSEQSVIKMQLKSLPATAHHVILEKSKAFTNNVVEIERISALGVFMRHITVRNMVNSTHKGHVGS